MHSAGAKFEPAIYQSADKGDENLGSGKDNLFIE